MKYNILFLILFASSLSFSQIDIKKPVSQPCWTKSQQKMQNRYMDFDCNKFTNAVDCNEKLEYQEQDNRFFSTGTGSPYNGECVTCHQNGVLEHHIYFVDGREQGRDTTYYYSGCPMLYRENINGEENGIWKYFYDSTQYVAWQKQYKFGKKVGTHYYFDNKGDTAVVENYANDVLNGVKKIYFTQNRIKKVINYKNGFFDGQNLLYNLDGKLIQQENFKAVRNKDGSITSLKDGVFFYYYDDGTPMKEENWKLNKKNGAFKIYFYDGKPMSIKNYKNGINEGLFEEYYSNGRKKSMKEYKKGILTTEFRYNEQGDLTYSYPENAVNTGIEDDQLPDVKKKKKK